MPVLACCQLGERWAQAAGSPSLANEPWSARAPLLPQPGTAKYDDVNCAPFTHPQIGLASDHPDYCEHGTMVASVALAASGNGYNNRTGYSDGIVGVAWQAGLLACRAGSHVAPLQLTRSGILQCLSLCVQVRIHGSAQLFNLWTAQGRLGVRRACKGGPPYHPTPPHPRPRLM